MPNILTINGGSSSVRFAVFEPGEPPRRLLQGKIDRIGGNDACLVVEEGGGAARSIPVTGGGERTTAIGFLVTWLEAHPLFKTLGGVGHRIVHGMRHAEPERLSTALLDEIKGFAAFDPEHLPREIELIEALSSRFPGLEQVLCFDTAFHRTMPSIATLLPIPRRYFDAGVQRYGFHGLSYTFLMQELTRQRDPAADAGRVILAHLGSGASLAAVRNGRCIDTSMGFTPTAGLVMGTRSGDLDPGLMSYLASTESMTAPEFQTMVNHESGLLGISQSSGDVRDLIAREQGDTRAAQALAIFCYQAKKWIGSFAAVLGGLDTLVFAGGIGENSAPIRQRICEGLEFLGIHIDESANDRHAACISSASAAVTTRVIRTDEESVIAASSIRVLGLKPT